MTHWTAADRRWMMRAIEIGAKGGSSVHPNPKVGAVLATPRTALAEGAHLRFGCAHAEIHALESVGHIPDDATLYVTLEPCSHTGKTPPCTDAIIRSGVRRVVAAMKDPNPIVSGQGFRKLRQAGISVSIGLMEKEAAGLASDYLWWIKVRRPYVVGKIAQSLDGAIATSTGKSRWISGLPARRFTHQLRAGVDAVMVGANTALKDDPRLTVRHGAGKKQPMKVVLDSLLRIPESAALFRGHPRDTVVLFTSERSPLRKRARFAAFSDVVVLPELRPGRLDLGAAMHHLSMRGVRRLLLEGGGCLLSEALFQHLVDELYVITAPMVIGGDQAVRSFPGEGAHTLETAVRFKQHSFRQCGNDIIFHGVL